MEKETRECAPVIIGCDHGGFRLKGFLLAYLREMGVPYTDIGCDSEEIVRYPYYACEVAKRICSGEFERGILICSTGIGMSIAANRYPGIRASAVGDHYTAGMTRRHNDSNILCLGGKTLGEFAAIDILSAWLSGSYEGGRHAVSLGILCEMEAAIAVEKGSKYTDSHLNCILQ